MTCEARPTCDSTRKSQFFFFFFPLRRRVRVCSSGLCLYRTRTPAAILGERWVLANRSIISLFIHARYAIGTARGCERRRTNSFSAGPRLLALSPIGSGRERTGNDRVRVDLDSRDSAAFFSFFFLLLFYFLHTARSIGVSSVFAVSFRVADVTAAITR